MKQKPTIAIVYDRVNSVGGAEVVLQELHTVFPEAPLITSVYESTLTPWTKNWEVRPSWLQHWWGAKKMHRLLGWLMPLVFETVDLQEFDIVISVTSEAAKGVLTKPEQLHICYLLTPTRYLWSHAEEYLQTLPVLLQPLAEKVIAPLQRWDQVAAQRPDYLVPISQRVKERAEQYYQRQVLPPLYPPAFLADTAQKPQKIIRPPFFITWGRHVAYKKFDRVMQAAVQVHSRLIIAGEGPETSRLRSLAKTLDPQGKYVFFVGKVSSAELRWYLERATAALFPQEEDYGITIMEAHLAGCPVVVHEHSGAAERLRSKDAVFLRDESVESIKKGLTKLRQKTWDRLDIRRHSRQDAGVRFQKQWRTLVTRLWQEHHNQLGISEQ